MPGESQGCSEENAPSLTTGVSDSAKLVNDLSSAADEPDTQDSSPGASTTGVSGLMERVDDRNPASGAPDTWDVDECHTEVEGDHTTPEQNITSPVVQDPKYDYHDDGEAEHAHNCETPRSLLVTVGRYI